ncbi:MAG: hypothetical protein ACHQNE_07700 [Candidatus Kapaibacterium sp.]
MKFFLMLLLLLPASSVFAQATVTAPDTSANPSLGTRPLPPSILAELRRSQKGRALIFRDTVSAQDIAREHINDTGNATYTDSTISLIDTAVSLPHKEWLDSELVEIPELARFGNRVHFNYPPAIMTETNLSPVPFDSTLLAHMNPVIRENLPFFDQSPLPMPLRPASKSESFLEAGAGNVAMPCVSAWLAQSLSERSSANLLGQYRAFNAAQSAVHSYTNILGSLDAQLGMDPAIDSFQSQDLTIEAGYNAKSVAITNTSTSDHALSDFFGSATLAGDVSKAFHYDARFADHEFADNYSSGASESSQDILLGTRFDLSSLRFILQGNYSRASINTDTTISAGAHFSASTPISASSAKALAGERGAIEWYAGAEYIGGTGVDGTNYSTLLPLARIRLPLNARWELGGSFEPQVQLASFRALAQVNPFYSPQIVLHYRQTDSAAIDARSVVIDKFNLAGFMSYMLSADDEIRFEARFIARDREPIFDARTLQDSTIFIVAPENTRRLSLMAAGNFLFFTRDVLSGSAQFTSATITGENRAIPFEPNFKFLAEYHFNSIWDNIQPSLAFQSISRPNRTLTFLDANVNAEISRAIALQIRAENILGGPSDFWPGYSEKPRSIWASIRYSF